MQHLRQRALAELAELRAEIAAHEAAQARRALFQGACSFSWPQASGDARCSSKPGRNPFQTSFLKRLHYPANGSKYRFPMPYLCIRVSIRGRPVLDLCEAC